jgi:hypothetical protein
MSLFVFLILLSYDATFDASLLSKPTLLYCTLLHHHGTQEGAMCRTTYQNITYKLCHFDTVYYTYSYYTYGWLDTPNLCREL